MNRFFTRQELAEAYRLPNHLHNQLLAEVAAAEEDDRGEPTPPSLVARSG